jgi:hypothetical protein
MSVHTVDMRSFSKAPFGRFAEDGDENGTAFRELHLRSAMADSSVEAVVVKLDSVSPGYEYGSSFLEEAFGGLVRVDGFSSEQVLQKLKIDTANKDYEMEIRGYIEEAGA